MAEFDGVNRDRGNARSPVGADVKSEASHSNPGGGEVPFEGLHMSQQLMQIDPTKIDFSRSVVLLNRSKRFVLPVPVLPGGGEELIYPSGPKMGSAIYTNKDGTIQRGIVFGNPTDSTWQGVQGNGKEAIIINDLSDEQASKLQAHINEICTDVRELTSSQIKGIVSFARDELGLVDMFDKDLESITTEMRFVDRSQEVPSLTDTRTFVGYMEVSKDTEHKAVRIERAFSLEGPVLQQYPHGAVVVTNGRRVWGVDKGVVQRNWVIKDAAGNEQPIAALETDVPEYNP
jgi:hypothetical protein